MAAAVTRILGNEMHLCELGAKSTAGRWRRYVRAQLASANPIVHFTETSQQTRARQDHLYTPLAMNRQPQDSRDEQPRYNFTVGERPAKNVGPVHLSQPRHPTQRHREAWLCAAMRTLERHRPHAGHSITAVRALESSLWATARGNGPAIRLQMKRHREASVCAAPTGSSWGNLLLR